MIVLIVLVVMEMATMAFPGPFCEEIHLQSANLKDNNVSTLLNGTLKNGHVLELSKFATKSNLPTTSVISWIHKLLPQTSLINVKTLSTRINRTLETNRKLVSKKKVNGFKTAKDFQSVSFLSQTDMNKLLNEKKNEQSSVENTYEQVLDCKSNLATTSAASEEPTIVVKNAGTPIKNNTSVGEIQEQTSCRLTNEKMKFSNTLDYEIGRKQKMLGKLQTLVKSERETLDRMKTTKGHYSLRNVTKRDATAAENRKLLRQAQTTILKQKQMIESRDNQLEQINRTKKSLLKSESHIQELLTENENLRRKVSRKVSDKLNAQKSATYFRKKSNKMKLGPNVQSEHVNKLVRSVTEKKEEIKLLKHEIEELEEKLNDRFETKSSNGSYNEHVRLCVIELAGLEVAVDKIQGHWVSEDLLGLSDIPDRKRFEEKLQSVNSDNAIATLHEIIKIVSAAMLRCIQKQLADFLPGGQYSEKPSQESLSRTEYAHPTNLSCEHHFGDLDSSQRKRPNASMHHHSTVQLLKRNRTDLMEWISDLPAAKKCRLMKEARKGGRDLPATHLEQEKHVINVIHTEMMTSKSKKKRKITELNETEHENDMENELPTQEDFNENEYIVVAYQDSWYPGCVEKISGNMLIVNFLAPTRKPGYFVWPLRKDVQTVSKEFVLRKGFIPECISSGRQWFLPDHEAVTAIFKKYSKVYF